MTSLPGTPENIKASLIRMDIDPDPELDTEGDFVVGTSLRVGWFAYEAGSYVLARRFDKRNASFETSVSYGRVDVLEAKSFGRVARSASIYFVVEPEAAIDDIAAEGTGRLLSGNMDVERMQEIKAHLDARERALAAWTS